MLSTIGPNWLYHPLGYCPAGGVACRSYNFWSGIEGALPQIAVLSVILTVTWRVYRHFQCHERTCHKLGVHHIPGSALRTCWAHHPELGQHPRHGVPLEHIHHQAKKARRPRSGG